MAWWLWETLFAVLRFSQIVQGLSWGDEELCSLGEEAYKDTGTFWSSHLLLEGPGGLNQFRVAVSVLSRNNRFPPTSSGHSFAFPLHNGSSKGLCPFQSPRVLYGSCLGHQPPEGPLYSLVGALALPEGPLCSLVGGLALPGSFPSISVEQL